jgi:GNAT superfamily N-acetyltransferase
MKNIRKATLQDLETLAVLFDQYRVFYKKESDLNAAKDFLQARMQGKESTIFVALQDSTIVGFVQLYPRFSSTQMKRLWLLNDLFVLEIQRGKGFSVLLLETCKQLCIETGACGLILETAKDNDIGNKLYPKTGFVLDTIHNFYSWDVK